MPRSDELFGRLSGMAGACTEVPEPPRPRAAAPSRRLASSSWRSLLGHPESLAEAESNYRNGMRCAHPDVGGDETIAVKLNAAIAAAREHWRALKTGVA